MKILCCVLLMLASAPAWAVEPCEAACPCDPSARRVVLYDDYGNQVVVTSYANPVDPSDYRLQAGRLDTDEDGLLSRREVAGGTETSTAAHNLSLEFDVVDRDRDGWLTPQELAAW